MSYNIKCTFFTDENGNQEIVSKGIINNLKIINSQKYSISFDDVNTTTDDIKLSNTEIYGHYYKEYSYSVPSDIIIEFNGTKLSIIDCLEKFAIKYNDDTKSNKFIIYREDLINLVEKYKIDYTAEDLINKTTNNIEIWKNEFYKENGYIYDQNSFIGGALYYYSKVEEERKKINDIQNIINGIEYYKLNLHQKENVMEDLQCATECMEVFETCYLSCRKMIDLFEYFGYDELNDDRNDRNSKIYCYISAV